MFVRNGDVKPERKRFSRGDDEQKDEELVTIRFKRGGWKAFNAIILKIVDFIS